MSVVPIVTWLSRIDGTLRAAGSVLSAPRIRSSGAGHGSGPKDVDAAPFTDDELAALALDADPDTPSTMTR